MSDPIPVLSMWEPWASLLFILNPATGLPWKTIETRSWPAPRSIIGQTIAIQAAKRKPDRGAYGPWSVEERFDGGWMLVLRTNGAMTGKGIEAWPLTLGAIIGTVTVDADAPIGDSFSFRTGVFEGDEGDFPGQPVIVRHRAIASSPESLVLDKDGRCIYITDQIPFGDDSPGRHGWMFSNARRLDTPVPFRGGQGLTKKWTPEEVPA